MSSSARPTIWAVLLLALATSGCEKPEDEGLGLDVLDPNDALGTVVVDTASLVVWTQESPHVRTSALSRNLLGTYLDPDFGTVTTGIVAQVRLSALQPADTNDPQCDSLILSLAYDPSAYGYGNLDPQGFKVFRLNEDLSTDSIYEQDQIPGIFLNDLVAGPSREFAIRPYTAVQVGDASLSPQLRIPLSRDLGNELLDQWGGPNVASHDAFLQYFKGLMIIPAAPAGTPYQNAVLHFNLLSADSKLTVFYHSAGDTNLKSFDHVINSSSVRYTMGVFGHDQAPEPGLPLALADSAHGQQEVFIQALGGLRGELRFPYLDHYDENGITALAKAELVFPIARAYYPLHPPPSQVFVFRKTETGADAVIPDQVNASNQVGGLYDATNQEYRLTITQWVQGVITGEYANTGLSIVAGSSGVTVNRAILAGPENPVEGMKLRLTFTTY